MGLEGDMDLQAAKEHQVIVTDYHAQLKRFQNDKAQLEKNLEAARSKKQLCLDQKKAKLQDFRAPVSEEGDAGKYPPRSKGRIC